MRGAPVRHCHGINFRIHLAQRREGLKTGVEVEAVNEVLIVADGVRWRGAVPCECEIGSELRRDLPCVLNVGLGRCVTVMRGRHALGFAVVGGSQQKVGKRASAAGGCRASRAVEQGAELVDEVDAAARADVCGGINGANVRDVRAELQLVPADQPVEGVMHLVGVVDVAEQAGAGAEAGKSGDADVRQAATI